MNLSQPLFSADFSPEALRCDLSLFFTPGPIEDAGIFDKIRRIEAAYARYLALYPYGLWSPGLVVIPEMTRLTEMLLPLGQISSAIRALSRLSCRLTSAADPPLFAGMTSWLELVPRLPQRMQMVNPARLLAEAAADEAFRLQFLFGLHLPPQHGECFGRYPGQISFLRWWLSSCFAGSRNGLRCLDAACGTGEGTYDLALLLAEQGRWRNGWTVHGMSRDPLEIFAAARGWFPHDPVREERFRRAALAGERTRSAAITFGVGDITEPSAGEPYDLIVCNGILGGPILHVEEDVERVVGLLASRLAPGGLLLAADRFHEGWERRLPKSRLCQFFARQGLVLVETAEGIGGTKKRQPGGCR